MRVHAKTGGSGFASINIRPPIAGDARDGLNSRIIPSKMSFQLLCGFQPKAVTTKALWSEAGTKVHGKRAENRVSQATARYRGMRDCRRRVIASP